MKIDGWTKKRITYLNLRPLQPAQQLTWNQTFLYFIAILQL